MKTLKVYTLLLGSNLGDRQNYIDTALKMIGEGIGTVINKTAVQETPAWGLTEQPDFLNIAIEVQTTLQPLELLEKTQAIENDLGRIREQKWGPRTLDIDVLYCGDLIMNDAKLVIPHPFLHQRKFTLKLLDELNPGFVHPVLEKTNSVLLFELENSARG